MNSEVLDKNILNQRQKIIKGQPSLKLVNPCKLGNGIVNFSLFLRDEIIRNFDNSTTSTCFFIPASGSGSRMFQFLFEFIDNTDATTSGSIEKFLNNLQEFAFFNKLPNEIKNLSLYEGSNLEKFIRFLLDEEGLGLSNSPKGLIPFHKNGPFILNAFQEQVLQANKMIGNDVNVHFTINEKYESQILQTIKSIEDLTGNKFNISFSIQDPTTDSYTFNSEHEIVRDENNQFLTRPSGHGALLPNLNNIDADLIFIKNIDNIQNYNQSKNTENTLKYLGGIAIWFKEEIINLINKPSLDRLKELNKQFQFLSESQINNIDINDLKNFLNKPIRVCGMVKNEGQPGGGPFWIEENGIISKQIVEKAQINNITEQFKIMIQSTHFNPVMIAAITRDLDGNKFNLEQFKDDSKYFIVDKTQKGKKISYIERPGLWNGSMASWNTIFVEIPSETFSPVKTVLDLLDKAHLES
jgi:hypothetical protein